MVTLGGETRSWLSLFPDKRREREREREKELFENRTREAEIDKSPHIAREIEKTKKDKKGDLRMYTGIGAARAELNPR